MYGRAHFDLLRKRIMHPPEDVMTRRLPGWFEVIAGQVSPTEGSAKCFGYV